MVHTRINERVPNPNHYINFISSLRDEDQDAIELLRALAAQVKPIMKNHGFAVNSLEEYEPNRIFLGRNWNNGETIELVLKDSSGRYYPTPQLLNVFCHELAHIKYMNHSAAFHSLRRQLMLEVFELQRREYFGDGYWSSGARLSDSRRIRVNLETPQVFPAYTCGGAYNQSRQSALRSRKRQGRVAGPSPNTGAQTAKRRKAGSRVASKLAFSGRGNMLEISVEKGAVGSGFGKRAASRRAREERAAAAERRLRGTYVRQIAGGPTASVTPKTGIPEDEANPDSDYELVERETDQQRLERMRQLMNGDLELLQDDYLTGPNIDTSLSKLPSSN